MLEMSGLLGWGFDNMFGHCGSCWKNLSTRDLLRGASKIENRENLGQCPNRGGRGQKKQKCPNFHLGILKTEGGVSIFQKCPNFNYLIVYFAILPL